LLAEARSQGNYRLYSSESLRRLKFIRAAQSVGFTLEDVRTLLGLQSGDAASCREVQALIEDRLFEVDKRLKDLKHIQRMLSSSLRKCRQDTRARSCHVIATLQRNA